MDPDDAELSRRVGEAELVRRAFEANPVAQTALRGSDLRFVAANAAYRAMAGRTDFIGRTFTEVFPEVVSQQLYDLTLSVLQTGQPTVAREWRVQIERNGSSTPDELYIDFTLSPWHDAESATDVEGSSGATGAGDASPGPADGVFIVVSDVTDRVRERLSAQARAAEAEQRYAAARDVVTQLQNALLPHSVPVIDGVDLAARYLVASRDQAAGGDWFDAIPLADGRLAVVVGDVVGHGVAASAAMGQLRAVLGAVLSHTGDLVQSLDWVDRLAGSTSTLRAATVCAVVLDPADGRLEYATCGHPPPLVVSPDGSTRFLTPTGGVPLGTGPEAAVLPDRLGPDDLLLLYTDGLVEQRGQSLPLGLERLARTAADALRNQVMPAHAPTSGAERTVRDCVELLTRNGYDDDVTAVAVQRRPRLPALHVELPANLASVNAARSAVLDWIHEIEPERPDTQVLELAVTELVANAAEHAYPARPDGPGPVRLDAALLPTGELQLVVADDGEWREPPDPSVSRGRGLWLVSRTADSLELHHDGSTRAVLRHRLSRAVALGSAATDADRGRRPESELDLVVDAGPPRRLRVSGVLDSMTAPRLADELEVASRGGVHPLTVDLSGVDLLASAAVRVLFDLRDRMAVHDLAPTLVAPRGTPAASVLDLVGLVHLEDETIDDPI